MGNVIWIFLAPFMILFKPKIKRRIINKYSIERKRFINETKNLTPLEWATIRSNMIGNVDPALTLENNISPEYSILFLSSLSEDEAFNINLVLFEDYITGQRYIQNAAENNIRDGLINPEKYMQHLQVNLLWPRLVYILTLSSCFDEDSYDELIYIWSKFKQPDENYISVFERLRFQKKASLEIQSDPLPENSLWLEKCKLSPKFRYSKSPEEVANKINKVFQEISNALKKYSISRKLILSYLNKRSLTNGPDEYSDSIKWTFSELENFLFDYSNIADLQHIISARGLGDYRNLLISLTVYNNTISFNVSLKGNSLQPEIITTKKGHLLKEILFGKYKFSDLDKLMEDINKIRLHGR